MRVERVILAVVVLAMFMGRAQGQSRPTSTQPAGKAAIVALHGEINDVSQNAFIRNFKLARAAGATTVIVDLDTYGGTVKSGLEISHFVKQQRDVRTIAFVNNKAISAGAMVAVACNEIVMVPVSGVLGDCAPIVVGPTGGMQPMPADERAKAVSPILNDFRESARENGYDPLLVESMVTADQSVYWLEKDGVRRFVDEAAWKDLSSKGWTVVADAPNPVDKPNTLLTVDGQLAVKLGLAKDLAPSREALLSSRNLQLVATYEPGVGEAIVAFLNNDAIRALLLTIFLTTFYIAIHAPGHGAAEAIALVALAVLVGVPLLTGYAQWWEIVAIVAGIGLLAIELFLIPGFGVAGFTGIALVLVGLILTFVAPEPGRSPISIPRLPLTWQSLQQGLLAVVAAMAASLLLSIWLRRYLPRLPYFNRLILTTTVGGSETAMAGSLTNIDPRDESPARGATGLAVTDLLPGGSAEFRDPAGGVHIVSVVSDSGFVPRGSRVVVLEVGVGRVLVRPVPVTETA